MTDLRVATFNVCNLFITDAIDQQQRRQGRVAKRRAELRALARGLTLADADVVALQEVGSLAALSAVNQLLPHPYPYLYLLPGNSSRGIHLAYASRYPGRVQSHQTLLLRDEQDALLQDYPSSAAAAENLLQPLRLQRDLLRLDLQLEDMQLSLFNLHLKSPNQPRWCRLSAVELRAAECRLVAKLIEEFAIAAPQSALMLLGDCNDLWPSAVLQPLQDAGLERPLTAQTTVLPASFWSRSITIDHILLNAMAMRHWKRQQWQVVDDKRARRGSDHCPVVLDLAHE